MNERRTEMHCHACRGTFTAVLDMGLNGNHEITCPCGHIHYRVVRDGEVTEDRYRSSAGMTFSATTITASYTAGTSSGTTSSNVFLMDSWANTTTTWG